MKKDRVLWADDEIELLKPHMLFLREKGYEVTPVISGQDAIDCCREQAFDIIFLDENMPGLTGLETLAAIKEITPDTPVVMVTKSEEESIMNQAIGRGRRSPTTSSSPSTPIRCCCRSRRTSTRTPSSPRRRRWVINRISRASVC